VKLANSFHEGNTKRNSKVALMLDNKGVPG